MMRRIHATNDGDDDGLRSVPTPVCRQTRSELQQALGQSIQQPCPTPRTPHLQGTAHCNRARPAAAAVFRASVSRRRPTSERWQPPQPPAQRRMPGAATAARRPQTLRGVQVAHATPYGGWPAAVVVKHVHPSFQSLASSQRESPPKTAPTVRPMRRVGAAVWRFGLRGTRRSAEAVALDLHEYEMIDVEAERARTARSPAPARAAEIRRQQPRTVWGAGLAESRRVAEERLATRRLGRLGAVT